MVSMNKTFHTCQLFYLNIHIFKKNEIFFQVWTKGVDMIFISLYKCISAVCLQKKNLGDGPAGLTLA